MRRFALCLAACGSAPAPAPVTAPTAVAPPVQVEPAHDEQARHDELAAAHRKLEEEQQDALAQTCDEKPPHDKHARCLPSCYPTETADARAGKRLAGAFEIGHLVCEKPGEPGAYLLADELDGAKLVVRPAHGRFPAAHKPGSWQAAIETALVDAERPRLPRGDAIVVSGAWRSVEHPLTKEKLRCVTVSRYARSPRRALDGCGTDGALGCEATGDAAARGLNVVHYRLVEARRLQATGDLAGCAQAALEAVAVARGLPRWRQYVKLNAGTWVSHVGYRTRFDGTLDEDALFAAAAGLGDEARAVHAACGGPADATTTPAQEQSFHTCW
jgi:hypothetical protein